MKKTVVKKTVSLQPDIWEYISSRAKDNASALIKKAVRSHRRRYLHNEMIAAYKAMASDSKLAEDLA